MNRRTAVSTAIVLVAVITATVPMTSAGIPELAAAFFAAWTLCLALLVTGAGGIYRPSAAYLILFGFFHGGLLLSIGLRGPDGFTAYDISWIYDGYTPEAVRFAILGMAAFTIVADRACGGGGTEPGAVPPPRVAEHSRLVIVSMSCLLAGMGIFVVAVADAGGLRLLSGGYLSFVQASESTGTLGYGTLLIGLGAVFGVAAGGLARMVAWSTFAVYATVAFLIGSRGAVLFPLLTLLVVEVRQRHRIRPLWTVAGTLGVLTLIGLVRQTRLTGFSQPWGSLLASPLDALAEMGYSLRPTAVVVGWHSAAEPFRDGTTLVAVPLRFIEKITGWHGGPPDYDDRLFNSEIAERVGPIGGSPIAEGYHNFGIAGVVLLMAAIGLVVGRVDRIPWTPCGNALAGAILLPLFVQVRNSFAPVPVQLALGLLLLWLVRVESPRDTPHPARLGVGGA
ncbi:MAG: hypothetical protein QOI21_2141 [Actinomycetota bacterium]|jgi:hypothetical protein|nr:hypothetical protein [Actinomycetota bacterium]